MHSIWDKLYDNIKDRRYGALFLFALLAFLGLPFFGAITYGFLRETGLEEYFGEALLGIGILCLVWCLVKFCQAWRRGEEKMRREPLSRDELRVARSKLRNGMKPMRRPAPRTPDTNLKY